jgi:putative ABC transport system permease protein
VFTFLECLRSAFVSIKAHGFRSLLTTLGIIIGVASVIATVSIVQGLSYSIGQQFEGLGANSLGVYASTPFSEQIKGRIARISPEDYDLISQRVDGISSITPILASRFSQSVSYEAKNAYGQIMGTLDSYPQVYQSFVKTGRFLTDSDDQTRRRVCVIGEDIRKDLELPENPIGHFIDINGEWVKIVGLLEAKGEFLGMKQDNVILLPFNTMRSLNGNQQQVDIQIQLTVANLEDMDRVSDRVRQLLRKAHRIENGDDDFKIQSAEQLKASISKVTDAITLVMGGIVSISLLVGGIGIMNIMLVSVTERTREIGICKAIGAKRHFILLQFLMESLALCLLGGIVGVVIGYGLGTGLAQMIPDFPPAHVPFWAIALSLGFSASIGLIFGIIPAAKAANLDPIESLRYE